MFIYVHQGRFSSTRTDCVDSSVFIFCQHIDTRESFNTSVDRKGGIVSRKKTRRMGISTVINEYQLDTLYINDFRQWSAFHIGIQLKRFAWLSTNHFIRLIALNLYVWHNIIYNHRFRCPMSESLLLFKVIPLRFSI